MRGLLIFDLDIDAVRTELSEERTILLDGLTEADDDDVSKSSSSEAEHEFRCVSCRKGFDSEEVFRQHHKTPWHVANVKRRATKRAPLSEMEYQHREECDLPYDSESDSSEDESSKGLGRQGAQILLKYGVDTLGIWWSVLSPNLALINSDSVTSCLRDAVNSKRWCVILCSGGHAAMAVVQWDQTPPASSVTSKINGTQGSGAAESVSTGPCFFSFREARKRLSLTVHKTFHRYIVRQKRGGRQSSRDAQGNAPVSAGASLRRHNERLLEQEIRDQLGSTWRKELSDCQLIFYYAPGPNRRCLFEGHDAPLSKDDPRVRRIPVPVSRPTMEEVCRVAVNLALVPCVQENVVPVMPPKTIVQKKPDPKPVHKDKDPEPNPEVSPNEALLDLLPATETFTAVKEGNKLALADLLKRGDGDDVDDVDGVVNLEVNVPCGPEVWTPLHVASAQGHVTILRMLLDAGADCTKKDARGCVPYLLAKNKETRDEFRRFVAEHPSQWDPTASAIPSALTDEMEREKQAKLKEKRKRAKSRAKNKKKEEAAEEERRREKAEKEREKAEADAVAARQATRERNLTLREQCALAVERRLGALGGASSSANACVQCGVSLSGKVPFERLDFKYCSMDCVKAHKKLTSS
eukprot:Rmarinus@m.13647